MSFSPSKTIYSTEINDKRPEFQYSVNEKASAISLVLFNSSKMFEIH